VQYYYPVGVNIRTYSVRWLSARLQLLLLTLSFIMKLPR